jgi:murein DD-endopeptidase MepM/ murein hydrolase activator NlpD
MVLIGLFRTGFILLLMGLFTKLEAQTPAVYDTEKIIVRSADAKVAHSRLDPSYLSRLRKQTDSLLFEPVDLKKRWSIVDEPSLLSQWAPTRQLVQVSEKIMIDSIWVTAHEYYALWDSWKIDIYEFDPLGFKDTLSLKLYEVRSPGGWSPPLSKGEVSSGFGRRGYRWHHGVDLRLQNGEPIYNVFDGIVRVRSYDRYGYGHYVLVRHLNGLETLYGHLSKVEVEVGQELKAGQLLGYGGNTGRSTGPHLHFELRYHGVSIDPEEVFDFQAGIPRKPTLTLTPRHFTHLREARESIFHSVRSGENLSLIGKKYGVSVAHLTKLNNIHTRTVLRVGQRLQIR